MHHPVFSAGLHGDLSSLRPIYSELRGHASMLLSGHDHDMQRLRPVNGITPLVDGAGGQELYPVNSGDPRLAFFDDTDQAHEDPQHPQEAQANAFTRNMLVPPGFWEQYGPDLIAAQENDAIIHAAGKLGVGVEILAGRVRWESGDYSRFSDLVGYQQVRSQFPEFN